MVDGLPWEMIASDPFYNFENFMLTYSLDEANQVNRVMNGEKVEIEDESPKKQNFSSNSPAMKKKENLPSKT
jgi:hypothetical protein